MPPPEHLGKYLITGVVGEGAMGVVYRGFDPTIGRAVAIKTLPRRHRLVTEGDLSASSLCARFRHEAQAGGRLVHPGIVAVHEYAEEDGIAYIVMEYVEGHNLSQWLARSPRLPEATVVQVMDQLLDALEVAHAAGVWHRDIKPSNLLVTATGRVKLTDFGIARFADQEATEGTSITGSPGYIAPEQYTGNDLDHRVDLFAAGVLLYRLLVGRAPFAGTPEQAMYKTLNEHPLPVSVAARAVDAPGRIEVPRDDCFDEVVHRALAKNPTERFARASDFRQALRQAAGWDRAAEPAGNAFADSGPISGRQAWNSGFGTLTDASPSQSSTAMRLPDFEPGSGSPDELEWHQGVEAALAEVLGPISALLMRRASGVTRDPAGLVARLAASIGDDVDRARFLRAVRRVSGESLPLAAAAHTFGVTGRKEPSEEPVRQGLPSADIGHALRVLTAHFGPEARPLIKGVAGKARSTEELHALIVAQVGERVSARLLLRQLQRGRR